MSQRATIRGAELCYDVVGSGPPALLIMGFGMSGRAWQPVLDGLADRYTLCWYDARGLGESTAGSRAEHTFAGLADDAAALLDHLGWPTAHVAGVSMGGMIGQHLALRHRARVRSLALLATHAGGGLLRTLPTTAGIRLFLSANLVRDPAQRLQILQQLLFPASSQAEQALAGVDAQRLLDLSAPSERWVRLKHLQAVLTHDTRAALPRLTGLPTVVLRPDLDVLVPPRCSDEIVAHLPGAEIVTFPTAGHGMLQQCHVRVNDVLAKHWAKADAPA